MHVKQFQWLQVPNVELPDCFINRFTNSGEYLVMLAAQHSSVTGVCLHGWKCDCLQVCFGNMQHDLVLYRCLGSGKGLQNHESASSVAGPASFDRSAHSPCWSCAPYPSVHMSYRSSYMRIGLRKVFSIAVCQTTFLSDA